MTEFSLGHFLIIRKLHHCLMQNERRFILGLSSSLMRKLENMRFWN
jgi:hypothetical protein